jgi:hypothetical protein
LCIPRRHLRRVLGPRSARPVLRRRARQWRRARRCDRGFSYTVNECVFIGAFFGPPPLGCLGFEGTAATRRPHSEIQRMMAHHFESKVPKTWLTACGSGIGPTSNWDGRVPDSTPPGRSPQRVIGRTVFARLLSVRLTTLCQYPRLPARLACARRRAGNEGIWSGHSEAPGLRR